MNGLFRAVCIEFGDSSKKIIGLADIAGIKENLVVYTNRRDYDTSQYSNVWIRPPINLERLTPWHIIAFKDFCHLCRLKP